jgi:hypothetical protein
MQTNYRPAFIEVVDDLGALDSRENTAFIRNVAADEREMLNVGEAVRDVRSLDRFWIVQIVGAYEGPRTATFTDFDPPIGNLGLPESKLVMYGVTPLQGQDGPSLVFLETIRDRRAYRGPHVEHVTITEDLLTERIVFHESLHRFNIVHGTPLGDEGPLSITHNLFGTDEQNKLTPAQLNVVRLADRPK